MKLLKDIPQEKYNDVQWVLNYLQYVPIIGEEDTKPIEFFHCFWKGNLSDLHLMCLDSLIKNHPTAIIFLWTCDALEVQGSYSWLKIKKLLRDNIRVVEVTKNHFREANAELLYSKYSLLTMQKPFVNQYNHDIAYASDIIRFIVLYIYGGVWFDMDVLFLRNLDSIKIKRYMSQWGTDMCGNGAILKLEKGHDLIQKILKLYPEKPFYPFSKDNNGIIKNMTCFLLENDLDITILPSTFFDILWGNIENVDLQFKTFDDFFIQEELMLPEKIYGYHWHNHWDKKPPLFFNK